MHRDVKRGNRCQCVAIIATYSTLVVDTNQNLYTHTCDSVCHDSGTKGVFEASKRLHMAYSCIPNQTQRFPHSDAEYV